MGDGQPNSEAHTGSNLSTRIDGIDDRSRDCGSEAASRFHQLWQDSAEPPDVFGFLMAPSPRLCFADVLATCLVDQRERWARGLSRPAEIYWKFLKVRFPAESSPARWKLVALEWQLCCDFAEHGREASLADFKHRFPDLLERLETEFGDSVDLDPTRDLMSHGESTESVVDSPALESTEVISSDHQAARDVDATTIEFEDDESTLSTSEFSIEHDSDSLLGQCSPFSQLPPVLVQKIESQLQPVSFHPGEFLMKQGDEGDGLFLILDGQVEIRSRDAVGESKVIANCSRGEILGEMALITDEPRTADVVATTTVEAKFLPQVVFDQLSTDFPVISQVLTQLLAARLGKPGHDALAGKTLSDYFIQNRLGRGGMAIVYKAEHTESGAEVALKMMSHRLVYDANALELFQRESRIIEGFDHPNIIRTVGRFRAFRSFFIVMEFCPGIALDQVIRDRGPVDEPEFRRLFAQIAAGLKYAHEQGVIHRDIKPSNIMLQPDGQVKLMDFGLAKPVAAEPARMSHLVAGTPRYMAPEQLQGKTVGTQADLFALGVTAWKLLTGKNLITSRSLSGIERQHASWKVPDLSGISPDFFRFACRKLPRTERSIWKKSPGGNAAERRRSQQPASEVRLNRRSSLDSPDVSHNSVRRRFPCCTAVTVDWSPSPFPRLSAFCSWSASAAIQR
jgi:hypothetical protein